MVLKTDPVPDADEDIIELTDIIQEGVHPMPGASAAPMDEHLIDLLNATADKGLGGEGADDLDAILAELGATSQASPPNGIEQTGQHLVNPDETLDMPDMQEVETLLDELSIPPQPSASSSVSATEQDPGSLDDILDQLSAGQPTPPVARSDAATSDPVDEIDALLDSVTAAPAPAARSDAATSDPADEIDALLDSVTADPADSSPPAEPDEGIDALPDSVPASAPISAPAAQKAKTSITITLSPTVKPAPPATSGTAAAEPADEMEASRKNAPADQSAPPESSQPAILTDDMDAFLESIPSALSEGHIDAAPPFLPEQPATETDDAAPSSDTAPDSFAPKLKTPAMIETPPLPHQWENLLGGSLNSPLTMQASEGPSGYAPVPPAFLEQLAHMEKRLTELDAAGTTFAAAELQARLSALEDTCAAAEQSDTHAARLAALEERIRALEYKIATAPAAAEERVIAALRVTLEKMEQRINALEETVRESAGSQPGSSDPGALELQEFVTRLHGTEEGLARLDARLEKMESGAGEEMDRAAAAAAARILREELAAILTE